ncbi:SGNH/GDSL hydrolase family protein [Opitutia bacterium ISCC 51]|nr:SGNH/GDSL hydrolase family protein [Opitutae bacterium ISCC 51]QXD30102.1 SGNH/GDSL hydrolase family protein [Opitutae bacterium ISCC 52]
MKHSQLVRMILSGALILFIGLNQLTAAIRGGDHIAIVGNTFADQLRNHGYLETLLLNEFTADPISMRNLGWGGDTLTTRDRPTNFPTEESTLTEHQADVIIACFGMFESFAGEAGLENFKSDLIAFIQSHEGKQYNDESEVRLILISPIAYENLGTLTPNWKQRNKDLKRYTESMGEVAQKHGIPFVDLYTPTRTLFDDESNSQLTTNGVHPNDFGYWAISSLVFKELMAMDSKRATPWRMRIDAKSGKTESNGVALSDFSLRGNQFSFQVEERSSPFVPPPQEGELPALLKDFRDTLVIENLEPGEYSLVVDGVPVVTATHEQWAQGVPIDSTPAHRDTEEYREAVVDKNTQFVYSWKALNQVHIVGERRNSSSGRALPAEVKAFNKLTKQKDKGLGGGTERKTRNWQVLPNEKLTN